MLYGTTTVKKNLNMFYSVQNGVHFKYILLTIFVLKITLGI